MDYRKIFAKAFALFTSLASVCCAQTTTVTGVVRDSSTSLPVKGAEVRLSKRDVVATTNKEGKFVITYPRSATLGVHDILIVKESKYWQKQVEIQPSKPSDVEIKLSATKQRLVVATDLGGSDPDDEQSMVHLLVSANEFDIEGLICGLAWVDNKLGIELLNSIADDYDQVLPNLRVHANSYPSYEYVKSIIKPGQPRALMAAVGEGKDSPGSELIIYVVDKDDPRPVWINAWGGINTLAQALWKIEHTRSPQELAKFVRKIRVYDILGQDDAGAWMVKTFPDLFYIRSKSIYGWAPSDEWVKTNVQSHGPLGVRYRNRIWATEGDSPAFMHVYSNGLNDPNEIDQGGWGGRFGWTKKSGIRVMDIARRSGADESMYDPYEMYTDTPSGIAIINRWKTGIYNDLEARMDWCIKSRYADANHHPIAVINGDESEQILEMSAVSGSTVTLDATGSSDPDHDSLTYSWSFYDEPSSYKGTVIVQESYSPVAKVSIPIDSVGKTIHMILEMHDNGTPNLYAYRRVILKCSKEQNPD